MKWFDTLTKPFAGLSKRDSGPLAGGNPGTGNESIIPPSDTFLERAVRTLQECDEDKEGTLEKAKRWSATVVSFLAPLAAVYVCGGIISDYLINTSSYSSPDFAIQMKVLSYTAEALLAVTTYGIARMISKRKLDRRQVILLLCGIGGWLLLTLGTGVAQYFILSQYLEAVSRLALNMILLRVCITAALDVLAVIVSAMFKDKTLQDTIDRNARIQAGVHQLKESEMAVQRTMALVMRIEQEEKQLLAERTAMIQQSMRMNAIVSELAAQRFEDALKQLPSGEESDGRRMRR